MGQVADVCRVSKKTVLNWIYDGGLKAFTTYGGHYRVWPANVKKFLDSTGMDIPFDFVDERTTNVLIVDDDADYTKMLASAIKSDMPDVEVHSTGSNAYCRAISTPFKYATNPSSYFIRNSIPPSAVGSATVNGIRTYTDEFCWYIDDSTSSRI